MFAQGDRTLERSHGGLGVGLSLARTVVELHDGTLEGFSDGPDLGSEFVVRLPMAANLKPAESAEPAAALPTRRSLRILIADDNLDSATTLAVGLRNSGHEVRTTPDGLSLLDAVEVFRPEVGILDIGMPGLNGYEVARRIRAGHGDKILLVAVTGWGQEEDKRRAQEAGFDHHLTKPITIDAIHQVLATKAHN
jgi:two-component system, sensor histidine kinase